MSAVASATVVAAIFMGGVAVGVEFESGRDRDVATPVPHRAPPGEAQIELHEAGIGLPERDRDELSMRAVFHGEESSAVTVACRQATAEIALDAVLCALGEK